MKSRLFFFFISTYTSERTCAFGPGLRAATQMFSVDQRWEVPPDVKLQLSRGAFLSPEGAAYAVPVRGVVVGDPPPLHPLTDGERVCKRQAVPSVPQAGARSFCTQSGGREVSQLRRAACPGIAPLLSLSDRALSELESLRRACSASSAAPALPLPPQG